MAALIENYQNMAALIKNCQNMAALIENCQNMAALKMILFYYFVATCLSTFKGNLKTIVY